MKIIRNLLIIVLGLFVQSVVAGRFDIYGVRPDLAMLVLLYITGKSNAFEGVLYGFLIGFFQDVYTPEYLGYNALTMSLLGFMLGFVRERVTVEKIMVRIFVTFVACIVHDLFYLVLYTQFDLIVMANLLVQGSIAGAFYTAVLAVLFITVWEWLGKGEFFGVVGELLGNRR